MSSMKLDKDLLEELYIKKNLTSEEIGKLLGYSKTKISYWLRKHNVPRKPSAPRKKYNLTESLLKELYMDKRLSCHTTGKKLNIPPESIMYWLRKYNIKRRTHSEIRIKYTKFPFSGDLKEKAYMLGLRSGDISARVNHNMIRVYTGTSHLAQLKMFKKIFEKYSHVHTYITSNNNLGVKEWHMYCDLDKSFEFLLEKPNSIPNWILENIEYFFAFVASYMDCEGTWDVRKSNKDNIRFSFRIRTCDKEILLQIIQKLKENNYRSTFILEKERGEKTNVGIYNKDFWCLALHSKKEVVSLASTLVNYSYHSEKIRRMKLILKLKDEINWSNVSDKVLKLRAQIKEENINVLMRADKNERIAGNNKEVTRFEDKESFHTIS